MRVVVGGRSWRSPVGGLCHRTPPDSHPPSRCEVERRMRPWARTGLLPRASRVGTDRDLLDRGPRPRHRGDGRRHPVPGLRRRQQRALRAARPRRHRHPVDGRADVRLGRPGPAAGRVHRPGGAHRAEQRRPAAAAPAGRRPRGERRPRRLHRRLLRRRRRSPDRRHLRRPGQHGRRRRWSGSRWSSGSRTPAVRSRSGCSAHCRRPRRPAATSGAGGRRRSWSSARPRPAGRGTTPWSISGSTTRPTRSPRWPTCWSPAPGTRTSSAPSSRRSTATRSPPTASWNCCGRWTR